MYQRFGGTYCRHLQAGRKSLVGKEIQIFLAFLHFAITLSRELLFLPEVESCRFF
jgi:hypothetical protein